MLLKVNAAPGKVTAIAVAAGMLLFTVSCSPNGMQSISTQAKEVLKPITSVAQEEDVLKHNFPGRGIPKLVDLASEQSNDPGTFDPAQAANTDLITLAVNYRVVPLKENPSIVNRLGLGMKPKFVLVTLIPKTLESKQQVLSTQFSVKPSRVFDLGNNRYAEFIIDDLKDTVDIRIESRIKLFRYDLSTAKSNPSGSASTDSAGEMYLKEEEYIDLSNPVIKAASEQIQGQDDISIVRNIYDFDLQTLSYDYEKANAANGRTLGASAAILAKKGVCVEYADVFVALCRAKGIPAKYVGGIPTEGGLPSEQQGVPTGGNAPTGHKKISKGHAWAEAYIRPYGWVPFDPTWGDTKAASFDRLRPLYVYLTDVRNDEVLGGSDIYMYKYWGTSVNIDFSMEVDSSRAAYLSKLLSQINGGKAELDQLKKQLDASYSELEFLKAELGQLNGNLKQLEAEAKATYDEGAIAKYNSMVETYNAKVAAYNKKVGAYQAQRDVYEAKRRAVNAQVDRYNSLN
ncbi:MAG: hypothetical protein K6T91_05510 [Firmicutes bacterium]|nr:hypothetical protein [Bacillota bacterium]